MKISGKFLAISAALLFTGYLIAIKFATPSALVEVKEAPQKSWLVLGKTMKGKALSKEFKEFSLSMRALRKEMGDSLPEFIRYYEEPTTENERFTSVFSGLIVPDSSFQKVGYQLKEIELAPSVQIKHKLNAGLYNSIDDYAQQHQINLDKNNVVEIFTDQYTAIWVQKK